MKGLPLLASLGLLAVGCDVQVGEKGVSLDMADGKASDDWVRSYTLRPGGTLEITNVNGEIAVSGSDGPQVEVRARRNVRTHSDETAQEALRRVRMDEDVTPDRVAIASSIDRAEDGPGFQLRSPLSIAYDVRVPAGLIVSVKTEQGGVRLEDVSGRMTAATTNGGITGRGLSGAITASAVNGGVQLDLATIEDTIAVSTTNGGVRLELPADGKATLEGTCVNGGIDVDQDLAVVASASSRCRLAAMLNGGGARVSAATVNGGIRIRARRSPPR